MASFLSGRCSCCLLNKTTNGALPTEIALYPHEIPHWCSAHHWYGKHLKKKRCSKNLRCRFPNCCSAHQRCRLMRKKADCRENDSKRWLPPQQWCFYLYQRWHCSLLKQKVSRHLKLAYKIDLCSIKDTKTRITMCRTNMCWSMNDWFNDGWIYTTEVDVFKIGILIIIK